MFMFIQALSFLGTSHQPFLGLEIRSARRSGVSLAVAPSGALQVIAAESDGSVFMELTEGVSEG